MLLRFYGLCHRHQLLTGGNAQLTVDVLVVIFQRVFLDAQDRQDLFGGGAFQIQVENAAFRLGQGRESFCEEFPLAGIQMQCSVFQLMLAGEFLEPDLVVLHLQHFHLQHLQEDDEQAGHDVGDRQKLEVDVSKLLHQPYADIDENCSRQNGRVQILLQVPLLGTASDADNHGQEIDRQVHVVEHMPWAVFFDQHGRAIRFCKGHVCVVDVQVSRACCDKEYSDADRDQKTGQPFPALDFQCLQDDHQHGQRQEDRACVRQAVCPKSGVQRIRYGKGKVSGVYHEDGRKQHEEPSLFLFYHDKICSKQQE